MGKRKQKMSMVDAMALVDDDLPDGAYWAMVHEMAGLEYGDGFEELGELAAENGGVVDVDKLKQAQPELFPKTHATIRKALQELGSVGHQAIADAKRDQIRDAKRRARTCPFCKRMFGSPQAMHSHRAKVHPRRMRGRQ